jgi:glycosyltransferase involved in cell wall biosynthesis
VESGMPYFRNKLYFLPYRNFLRSNKNKIADRLFLANSKFTAKAIKEEIGVDSHVLYPPVAQENFNEDLTNFSEERDNHVITVSRISAGKNLMSIPYIAKSVSKEISFSIVGLLDSKEVLVSLLDLIKHLGISSRVSVMTNVSRKQLRKLLLRSKVYLHTSVDEHFGVSIVEAMSLGCVPVVHDSGGPKEFVSQAFRFKSVDNASEMVEKAVASWSQKKARTVSESVVRFNENSFSRNLIGIFNAYLSEKYGY